MMMNRLTTAFFLLLALSAGFPQASARGEEGRGRNNVLLIAVDDLRPELGCYGAAQILSPNIDRFAESAVRFERAYCQQAVCNPSRTSLLTGLRPDTIGVTGNHSHFRTQHPDVVTLPQHFKNHGYHAAAIGKIYHGLFPDGASITTWDTMGDPQSWSVPAIRFGPRYYYTEEGIAAAKDVFRRIYKPKNPGPEDWTQKLVFGPATESPDVADDVLYDGKVADAAIAKLNALKTQDAPFFLAVGFIKPHSPYVAPKKYFDLYQDVRLPSDPEFPNDAPAYAGHRSGELRRYTDQPARGPISDDAQRRVRQAYYACVSYIDAQIGRVLDALKQAGLEDDTIVCLFGDHGYHLGEQGLWGKTTNFELDTHVPLIVRAPGFGQTGVAPKSLVELVDIYPTLADLAGLPISKTLQGQSLTPLLVDPQRKVKEVAWSQYPRGKNLMGYSMRTDSHRLTTWVERDTGKIRDTELYRYTGSDAVERENIAAKNPELVKQLRRDWNLKTPAPAATGTFDFEAFQSGEFTELETPAGRWKVTEGKAKIDNRHAATGKQCLQLPGGQMSILEFTPAVELKSGSQLTFKAERWTKREPFFFQIDKRVEGRLWETVYDGDKAIKVGRPFLSDVRTTIEGDNIRQLRFVVKSPANTGILIDDLRISEPAPQKVTAADVISFTLPALVGSKRSALLKLRVQTTGTLDPISLASLTGTLQGTSDVADIESVWLCSSGANSNFEPDKLSAGVPSSSDKLFALAFDCPPETFRLLEGDNFFWVACQLKDTANIDNFVGAVCSSVTFSNGETTKLQQPASVQRMGVAVRSGGDDGVHTFRIPGLATTNAGTLIGVYDVRRRGGGDLPGDIDVGMSRSTDGGRTWQPMQIIMDMGNDPAWKFDGIGDPTILVDRQTGTIWCAATWSHGNRSWFGSGPGMKPEETGQFMLVKSDDDGQTWSKPINITGQVKRPEWAFILQGPGKGSTMGDGTLVLPAQYQDPPNAENKKAHRLPHSTFIYSRDHGETWTTASGAWDDTTESQIVELNDGRLMINARTNRSGRRAVLTTDDMGKTWQQHPSHLLSLHEPGACMASLIRVPGGDRGTKNTLLFSNPDSHRGRNHITIKASLDDGRSWPDQHHLLLDQQNGRGYSCMTSIDNDTIGILYEGSQAHMTFQRVPISQIIAPPEDQKTKNPATRGPPARALSLGKPFGSSMVLQADATIRFWGHANPGASVSLTFDSEGASPRLTTCTAGNDGKWALSVAPKSPSAKPICIRVSSLDETIDIQDILIGEVWICAGQSNMEWTLAKSDDGQREVATSDDPLLRLFQVNGGARGSSGVYNESHMRRLVPERFGEGTWKVASPTSSGEFSAVGYHFARQLRDKLKVPIGIINVAVGGTPIESWVSEASLRGHPKLAPMLGGNWLENPSLDPWCQQRARLNLRRGLAREIAMPEDEFGPNHSFKPGFMFRSAIAPLSPLSLRGAVWYQGESNADSLSRIQQYDAAFPLLVSDWRKSFANPAMPIGFVQLPAMGRPHWPLFREYQRRSLAKLQHVGMAITIDTGHATNVHPPQKRPVGQRLASWALAEAYAHDRPATGPLYRSCEPSGDSMVVTFDEDTTSLRTIDDEAPSNFELAGSDGIFHSAEAKIVGARILLRSAKVPSPKHVRYAWAAFPIPKPNLINGEGLPASPFTSEEVIRDADAAGAEEQAESRPNILLIVSEDNGPELGCYGDPYAQTPRIDQLAHEGVRFETAYVTQAVCSSSRSSLFTGLYPHQNGQIGLATHQYLMRKAWPTTYSLLKQAGYRTGLLGKTHVNPVSLIEDDVDFRYIKSSNFAKKNLGEYSKRAGEFFNDSDTPFFLTVNLPDAHWPVQNQVEGRPKTLLGEESVGPMPYIGFSNSRLLGHLRGFYNCMSRLDECVGEILDTLESSGKANNTLLIYIGDHGAQFARGKVFVTEGGLRIPFIVRWPGHTAVDFVSQQMVSTVDILPTLTAASGAAAPSGLPGKSLLEVLNERNAAETAGAGTALQRPLRTYLFGERNCDSAGLYFPQRAVRDSRYKLIKTLLSGRKDPGAEKCLENGASNFRGSPTYEELKTASPRTRAAYATWLTPPKYQLYDLQNDRHEFVNLAEEPEFQEIKQTLIQRLEQWQMDTDDPLRHADRLAKLTEENDTCIKKGIRSPKAGWKYVEYLYE